MARFLAISMALAALVTLTHADTTSNDFPALPPTSATLATTPSDTNAAITVTSTPSTTTNVSVTTTQTSIASFITTDPNTATDTLAQTSSVFHLPSVPSLAGVGVPTMVVPYTADAPFMQKSQLPEGTVFIAVGAVLAFMGACVLLWRALVAWSINHSVKKAALASVRGNAYSEKDSRYWRGTSTYQPSTTSTTRRGLYRDEKCPGEGGTPSSERLYHNTTSPPSRTPYTTKPHMRESIHERPTSTPAPQKLFFSPTAQQTQSPRHPHRSSNLSDLHHSSSPSQRTSAYMPAGYYNTTVSNTTPSPNSQTQQYQQQQQQIHSPRTRTSYAPPPPPRASGPVSSPSAGAGYRSIDPSSPVSPNEGASSRPAHGASNHVSRRTSSGGHGRVRRSRQGL